MVEQHLLRETTKEKRSRETSTGTLPGMKRSQEIMVEQHLLSKKRKNRKVGRQVPEPYTERKGAREL